MLVRMPVSTSENLVMGIPPQLPGSHPEAESNGASVVLRYCAHGRGLSIARIAHERSGPQESLIAARSSHEVDPRGPGSRHGRFTSSWGILTNPALLSPRQVSCCL